MSENEILELEAKFPLEAPKAFEAAKNRAFKAGCSVLFADDGMIYRVFPDGRRVPLKAIPKPIPAVPGTILFLP